MMDLKQIVGDGVDRIHLARYLAAVKTVMNHEWLGMCGLAYQAWRPV
jgi:hypothetical protein